jgi:hypothetical protein
MFDSFNNCLIVVRYGFNLVFVVRMVLNVRLNWLYDVKKGKTAPHTQQSGMNLSYLQMPVNLTYFIYCFFLYHR